MPKLTLCLQQKILAISGVYRGRSSAKAAGSLQISLPVELLAIRSLIEALMKELQKQE